MTFMIIYVGLASPYVSKQKTFFEQFNEFFIGVTVYHLMAFADVVQDQGAKNTFGWSLIACFSFCLVCNIGFILRNLFIDSYKKIRFKYYTNKL